MFRRIVSVLLMLAVLPIATLTASAQSLHESKRTKQLKRAILLLGTGPSAQVQLKLRDKTTVRGYVAEVNDNYFTVVDSETQDTVQVAYPQVARAKGNNLSSEVKFAIGAGVIIAVLIAIGLATR